VALIYKRRSRKKQGKHRVKSFEKNMSGQEVTSSSDDTTISLSKERIAFGEVLGEETPKSMSQLSDKAHTAVHWQPALEIKALRG